MGPLSGVRIVEIAGVGPGPFSAMMLADMGADVIRVAREGAGHSKYEIMNRGRRSISLNLKKPEAVDVVLRLVESADALQEGFRPGVMEKLGLGPDVCLARNERLVYGRLTGWGQEGPIAQRAGHDINYIALSGALKAIGRRDARPTPPLNLVGDFGGGGMYMAFGIVCGILEARLSGKGQVIDCAMLDGALSLMTMFYGYHAAGSWSSKRGDNIIDSGLHCYDVYECADGEFISVGPLEPQFYALLRKKLNLTDPGFDRQMDRAIWPELKSKFESLFKTKTRAEWAAELEEGDYCCAPVLGMDEAPSHPHNRARGAFVEIDGITQPAPAPRFSRTVPTTPSAPDKGEDARGTLSAWGFSPGEIDELKARQVI